MDYIKNMRKYIGNETLFTVGCGIIIEDHEQILLQHRTDEDNWCIPGGMMEIGETFEEAATRESLEETGLTVTGLELFGMYSGEKCFVQYPNGDKAFSVQIIFLSKQFTGELKQKDIESREHRFFSKTNLPANLNPRQKSFIIDWAEEKRYPIIK
ncbi:MULTISPECIES: NUDIX hydrolase [Bacillaceae]|uniref:NUDIX hydrolase n=1 Tax=Bacillaceae TaxID=186817 RepID=UPI000BED496C|nr:MULTISPECIES: NUDIX hydrolase [unclassified Bacillus (in: firmicutes)]PEC48721.1 NUDIX hydrolase [Bacillus sp. AFS096315]PFM82740.1 NUDIX hydrolase [Bacillus sp. AFS077874]